MNPPPKTDQKTDLMTTDVINKIQLGNLHKVTLVLLKLLKPHFSDNLMTFHLFLSTTFLLTGVFLLLALICLVLTDILIFHVLSFFSTKTSHLSVLTLTHSL